jgi:tetratricopeptide (TPR) repeat protein
MDPNFSPDLPNVGTRVRIPNGRRRLILVAAVAVAAGVVTAAVVLATRGGGGDAGPAATTAKPLAGRPPLFLDLPGPAVRGGNAAVYAAAQKRLPAGDVRLAVARAMVAYSPAHRDRTLAALRRLPQRNPAVAFALGMAQLWAGQPQVAALTLERVKRLNPYGYYGTNADDLLHLGHEAPGYPPYFPPSPTGKSLRVLQAAVAASPTSSGAWLALAARLERTDRLAAQRDALQAARLNPQGISEQVAVAVLGFDKDAPMKTLQTMLTLASETQAQQDPEVLFHLGLVYFWMQDRQDAAGEFSQVESDAPHSHYAPIAHVFARCIDSPAACRRIAAGG